MRVFFDTNVLISAFIARGASSEVFEHCLSSCQVLTTSFVLDELKDVLTNKLRLSTARVTEISGFLSCNLELVDAGALDERACRDPDDDFILSGALAADADCLITGDDDLLFLKEHKGIQVFKPGDFWRFEKAFDSSH